ncbi:MAG: OmpA family protein [Cyclobacteriaceae bacterium]|nr:OmpA family protein [Cyclobacteriaceae bacterium]
MDSVYKRLLTIIIFSVLALPLFSQQDSIALSKQYYAQGMEIFDYEHRKVASELFLLAVKANPKNAEAQFMAGRSIMLTVRKELSLQYFKSAYQLEPKIDPDILFYLGQAYHYSEKFDSAIMLYDRYNRLLARSLDYEKSKKINEVNRKIFECHNAKIMIGQPVDVTISHLSNSINSEWPDYAPTINADETFMVFTTRRPEENMNNRLAQDNEYYEEIFYSKKVDGEWTPARNLSGPLNNNYHNASINLSPDGKEMLLYHDSNGGDILASFLKPDGTWTDPKAILEINTEYIENSATITADGKQLFFTSNRPGGYGGTDIYVSVKDAKGRWGTPRNLGRNINTDMDEDGVYVSASGKHLYFSSNGHAGMGDLDIYRSTFNAEKDMWEKPINMGYPINSVENDIYIVLTRDEDYAYISSVRPEGIGEQDIYKIDIRNWKEPAYSQPDFADAVLALEDQMPLFGNRPVVKDPNVIVKADTLATVKPAALTPAVVNLTVYVAEGDTKKPLSNVQVKLTAAGSDQNLAESKTGTYSTIVKNKTTGVERYKLLVSSLEHIPYSSTYVFGPGMNTALNDTIYLDKIAVNYRRTLNVYFGHDSDVPKSFEDILYLEQIMKTSSSIKVEISGHTDNIGSYAYNVGLSRRRAMAVKKHLVNAGIDESRITVAGYGPEKPIADNNTRANRQLNRRTEFTIVEK